jgi:hypothetical protein
VAAQRVGANPLTMLSPPPPRPVQRFLFLCLRVQTLGLTRKTRRAGFGPAGRRASYCWGDTCHLYPCSQPRQKSPQQQPSWSERNLSHILKMNKSTMARKPKRVGPCKYFVPMSIGGVICKAMVDSGNLWKNVLLLDFLHQLGLTRDDLREVPGIQEVGTAKSGTGLKVLGELKTPIHLRFGGCAT